MDRVVRCAHCGEAVGIEQQQVVIELSRLLADVAHQFVQPIAGRPGAGKTYALEAVVAAHLDAGVPIVGCPPALGRPAKWDGNCALGSDTAENGQAPNA